MIRSMHHICIQTSNYAQSKAFYCDLLGFECIKETAPFHERAVNGWLTLPAGGPMIELQTAKEGETLQPWSPRQAGPVHLALLVDNVQETYERLRAANWQAFKRKPDGKEVYLVENSWLCKVIAPEGTEIELRDVASLD